MDDKKKFIVLGGLVAVIIGVGVFQFTAKAPPPAAPSEPVASKPEGNAPEGAEDPKAETTAANVFVGTSLPRRDPFKAAIVAAPPTPVAMNTPPAPTQAPNFGSGTQAPGQPPLPLLGGINTEPSGNNNSKSGTAPVQPDGPPQEEKPAFGYTLAGVIVGNKSAAVFIDGSGNQRLVPLGGSLDGDTKVVNISRGRVTVRHGDETLTLSLGGNPIEK